MARSRPSRARAASQRIGRRLACGLLMAALAWPVAGVADPPFWKGSGSRPDLRQGYIPAQPAERRHERDRRDAARELRLSLEEAVEQVRDDTGGRILSAKTVREDGDTVYRIKLLTPDNRVQVVRIDAHTGERLR